MLLVKGVNLHPSDVEPSLLAVEELAPPYQLVVDRGATLARLEVQVEAAPELIARCGGFAADHPEIPSLRRGSTEQLRQATGLGVEITAVATRTIPRAAGQAMHLVARGYR